MDCGNESYYSFFGNSEWEVGFCIDLDNSLLVNPLNDQLLVLSSSKSSKNTPVNVFLIVKSVTVNQRLKSIL